MMEDSRKFYHQTLGEILKEAKKHGIKIAVENGGYPLGPYNTIGELEKLVEKREDVGACLDIGHAFLEAKRREINPRWHITRAIEKLSEKLIHVHVHDNGGYYDEHLIPGEEEIDFTPIGKTLRRARYDGAVVVELFRAKDELRAARLGLQRIQKMFG